LEFYQADKIGQGFLTISLSVGNFEVFLNFFFFCILSSGVCFNCVLAATNALA